MKSHQARKISTLIITKIKIA